MLLFKFDSCVQAEKYEKQLTVEKKLQKKLSSFRSCFV